MIDIIHTYWSGHHFYENSASDLFSFLKRWNHRQYITLLSCGFALAQIVFLLIITLLQKSKYIHFVPYTLSTRFLSLYIE